MQQCLHLFSDMPSVSDEVFGVFTLKCCWESWIPAMTNFKSPGTATIKYKHTASKSNINYQIFNVKVRNQKG